MAERRPYLVAAALLALLLQIRAAPVPSEPPAPPPATPASVSPSSTPTASRAATRVTGPRDAAGNVPLALMIGVPLACAFLIGWACSPWGPFGRYRAARRAMLAHIDADAERARCAREMWQRNAGGGGGGGGDDGGGGRGAHRPSPGSAAAQPHPGHVRRSCESSLPAYHAHAGGGEVSLAHGGLGSERYLAHGGTEAPTPSVSPSSLSSPPPPPSPPLPPSPAPYPSATPSPLSLSPSSACPSYPPSIASTSTISADSPPCYASRAGTPAPPPP